MGLAQCPSAVSSLLAVPLLCGMLPVALKIAAVVATVYILVTVLAWKYQDRMAFPGPRQRLPEPAEAGLPDGRRVEITAADSVALRGWYLPPSPAPAAGARAPGLIWFYGNMETVAAIAPVIRELRPPGRALLILDYRGYGESDGTPSEAGVYRDAEAAWAYLAGRPDVDPERIALYGRSIGSAPALYLATERPAQALILDSPFTSAREMKARHYAFLPDFLVRLSLDNLQRARKLAIPLLVFHGSADQIAPVEMGQAVAAAGRAQELVVIEGAGHNETYDSRRYREAMHAFLARLER